MTKFAFVVHPLSLRDVARKYPIARYVPDRALTFFLRHKKPMIVSEVTGIRAPDGRETSGWFIGCPFTPKQMLELPLEVVYQKIVDCTELAAKTGAEIIGLGAFTSVVGDGGITIAERSPIPVTTGNSYTVATAIEGTLRACEKLGIDLPNSTLAIVGATGAIGKTCARILSPKFLGTLLVGRDSARTQAVADEIPGTAATTDLKELRRADVIITVTSADASIIEPEHLKPGCVVCDVARPRDVSVRVTKERPDVLVIEGGVVAVPGDPEFNFDFGFPRKTAYACMSETMMLALEGRKESFTLGKDVSVKQVEETWRMAKRNGFELAGFRSFERAVGDEAIHRAKEARIRAGAAVPRVA